MNHTLKKWIVDTVAADMHSSYRRAQTLPFVYDFMGRYADFYGKRPKMFCLIC